MGRMFAVDVDGTITENGAGRIHLDALGALRRIEGRGHRVIFVTGRSSVEGYMLSVFGGTTKLAVGENGGCISTGPAQHIRLGDMDACRRAYEAIRGSIGGVSEKRTFPRLTEVVLDRTFDLDAARSVLSECGIDAALSDSGYAYHINSPGIDKGTGLARAAEMLSVDPADVIAIGDSATDIPMFRLAGTSVALGNASDAARSCASMTVDAPAGDGVIEAIDRLAPGLGGRHVL